jgi:hypothetical protein
MIPKSACSLTILRDKIVGPIGHQELGAGGEQQQQQDSASGGVKRSRDISQKPAAADWKAMRRHSHCIGPSQFSHFLFTPLSDAIKMLEDRGAKAPNDLPAFNILATVIKWSEPKRSRGVNASNTIAHKANMWFKGSDLHVQATLLSNERESRIEASFFFDSNHVPKAIRPGDNVRLIGTRLQIWNDCPQLAGKNIQFGHSTVAMSLSDAIEAWKYVAREQPLLFLLKPVRDAQPHFPKLTLIVIVNKWANARTTQGVQLLFTALMFYCILIRIARSRLARFSSIFMYIQCG